MTRWVSNLAWATHFTSQSLHFCPTKWGDRCGPVSAQRTQGREGNTRMGAPSPARAASRHPTHGEGHVCARAFDIHPCDIREAPGDGFHQDPGLTQRGGVTCPRQCGAGLDLYPYEPDHAKQVIGCAPASPPAARAGRPRRPSDTFTECRGQAMRRVS